MAHSPFSSFFILFWALLCVSEKNEFKTAFLSNTELPVDTNGNSIFTGEATVLFYANSYYFYFNDWGNCSDVDCCTQSSSCASCCFKGTPNDCVYANGHNVRVYRTSDFMQWDNLGIALAANEYIPGTVFRPQVVYQPKTKQFLMWYEDRWDNGTNKGYAIAISSSPQGPFKRYKDSVPMTTSDKFRIGDYDLFIDSDGSAYHVRTGVVIEKLNDDWTGSTNETAVVIDDGSVEGPSMFKRNAIYYVLVYTANRPLGPYTFRGDVGSNHTNGHVFNAQSPYNYVTRAQGSKVLEVFGTNGTQYLWLGNQWVTSKELGKPRNKDLLYWTVLSVNQNGKIKQIVRENVIIVSPVSGK